MYLIQLLLPLHDNKHEKFPPELFESVRRELADRFGGVTAFIRSPAVGLWKQFDDLNRDEVVMFEVLGEDLDREWWKSHRQQLEDKFRQDEVLIWATSVEQL